MESNRKKILTSPVTAIVARDLSFPDKFPKLFTPPAPNPEPFYRENPDVIRPTAQRNTTLQGAYMIMAIRALGLDAAPMSGFDNAAVDKEFFQPLGLNYESDFICAFGYGEVSTLYKRNPRLDFDDACKIL